MIGAGLGLLIATGIVCVGYAVVPYGARTPQPIQKSVRQKKLEVVDLRAWWERYAAVVIAALGAAIAAYVVTGWVGAALGMAGVAAAMTSGLRGSGRSKLEAARYEGLAVWVESVRDLVGAGRGIESAVMVSTENAPEVIATELTELRLDVERGATLREALVELTDRIGIAAADIAVCTIVMALDGLASNPVEPLNKVAATTRQRALSIIEIDAERAGKRSTMRMMMVILALLLSGLMAFFRGFLEPYGDGAGQMVLVAVMGVIVGGFVWMQSVMSTKPRPRLVKARAVL